MGMNYYLITQDADRVKSLLKPDEYEVTDDPYLCYKIHLCKISSGWKPLMHETSAFKTMSELDSFYYSNFDSAELRKRYNTAIIDEYNRECSWIDFKSAITKHSAPSPDKREWYTFEFDNNPVLYPGGKKTLNLVKCEDQPSEFEMRYEFDKVKASRSELDICTPFDHNEYKEKYETARKKYHVTPPFSFDYVEYDVNGKPITPLYTSDPVYKVNWTKGNFS